VDAQCKRRRTEQADPVPPPELRQPACADDADCTGVSPSTAMCRGPISLPTTGARYRRSAPYRRFRNLLDTLAHYVRRQRDLADCRSAARCGV